MSKSRELWQSQNFLRRPEFVSGLVEGSGISSGDLVVEIGPGKGIITRQLAQRAEKVIAVEVDPKLASNLRQTFEETPNVEIVKGDFFKWQLPREPYKVFANIPFNMTADTVRKLTETDYSPEVAYLIMQDKALDRFAGKPKENQASVLLKPWFSVTRVTNIARTEFTPVPQINAVLAEFRKREEPLIDPDLQQDFRDFVVYGFNQWKPTALEAFGDVFSGKQAKIIERDVGIKGAKPTDLSLEQWVDLYQRYRQFVPESKKQIVKGAERQLAKKQKKHRKWHRTR